MQERKQIIFKPPDITKLQEVIINYKTNIYIAIGADPEEARSRYLNRPDSKYKSLIVQKKTAIPKAG
jgi:hypothetical protein